MSTIRDVAKESGVSVATVSYVLNNGPRPVSEGTRKRVLDVVERLDYHPNGMARGLARRRADTIGVLFPTVEPGIVTNTYAFGILQGILTAADTLGFNVTLYTDSTRKGGLIPALMDRRADGLLLVAPYAESPLARRLSGLRIPLVGISVASESAQMVTVDVDNILGARKATEHLVSLGHTRIAHLTGDLNLVSGRERREGFMSAMESAGHKIPEALIVPCSYASQARDKNKAAVRTLLSRSSRPTAIFAANDSLAIAAIEAAREVGLKVPIDVSIVGFDDIPSASLVTPPLTSVRQPLSEIGQQATRLLVEMVVSRAHAPATRLLEPELVIRASTMRT